LTASLETSTKKETREKKKKNTTQKKTTKTNTTKKKKRKRKERKGINSRCVFYKVDIYKTFLRYSYFKKNVK